MDWYEKELLARAVEAVFRRDATFGIREIDGNPVIALTRRGAPISDYLGGPTLADALTALLADLGEAVPERPSAERVKEARDHFIDDVAVNGANYPHAILDSLASLYAREPLTVLALIEGGEA